MNKVREALEGSVTCSPHSFQAIQVSIVPNRAVPSLAAVRAPSTFSRIHAALVPEK